MADWEVTDYPTTPNTRGEDDLTRNTILRRYTLTVIGTIADAC